MRFMKLCLFFVLFLFSQTNLLSDITQKKGVQESQGERLKVRDCLLPKNHFLQDRLKGLFQDPEMFESPQHWRDSGFQVIDRIDRRLMIGTHPKLKNYILKKFTNEVSHKRQLRNYLSRINGAENLREFIHSNKLQHVIVPKKWIYRLPKDFLTPKTEKRTYLLIVEKMDICSGEEESDGELARRYYNIDFEILKELCFVVFHFRGLDSALRNMPFTYQNKIAFIDTECWNCEREGFLDRVRPFMRQDRQDDALRLFEELSQG